MRASAGDVIAVPAAERGAKKLVGRVLEARGKDGAPPYLVRWEDGNEVVCYPGPQTRVQRDPAGS